MYLLLALFPLIAYLCIFIYLNNRFPHDPVRKVLLEAMIASGCYLALSMEVLSIFKAVTLPGLVIAWLLPITGFAAWVWRRKAGGAGISLPAVRLPGSWWDRSLLLILCIVMLATATVAFITPPQTWDSLTYHLARVAHWAQDRSIWHYATGIDRQTSMPPGAEEAILNFYVLTQGDRLSNIPQWIAMLGSVVGVSLIAYYLGAKSAGQWIAAVFAATIPVGIVEASNTINDYVAAFWVVCAVVEILSYYKNNETRSLAFASLAAGLALLTKPIAVPFLIPFAVWLAYLIGKRHGVLNLLKWGGVAILIVVLLNAGYLARNYITYGALSNPVDFEQHYNQLHSLPGFIATLLRNVGVQAYLPKLETINQAWYLLILKTVTKLGLDINDPRMTAAGFFHMEMPSTNENSAANPYHAYLIFILFVSMFFVMRKHGRSLLVYGLLAASTFLLFSFIYKWNGFGTRYDLAFFVLFAPVAGVILGGLDKLKVGYVVAGLLFVGSLPWLFSIYSRPLVASSWSAPGLKSILVTPRQDLYFADAQTEQVVYGQFTDAIRGQACSEVGIMLRGDDPEYLVWVLMGAPRRDLKVEWIVSGPTDRYSPADFKPCAIICKGCTVEQSPIRGLEIARSTGDFWLYLPPQR